MAGLIHVALDTLRRIGLVLALGSDKSEIDAGVITVHLSLVGRTALGLEF